MHMPFGTYVVTKHKLATPFWVVAGYVRAYMVKAT